MASNYSEACTSTLSVLGQALVDVVPSNTERLLSEASLEAHQRRPEADAILARLNQLNPAVRGLFQSKDEILSDLQLRLIHTPQDGSSTETRPDFSAFIIISYCWHYPQWPLAPAAQPIAPAWEISQPMVDAVMGARESPLEGVWLDKMCINQSDPKDKKQHIGAMDIIYRSARRVMILLEDIQLTKEEDEAGLVYAGFYADLGREVMEKNLEGQAKGAFIEGYFPNREKAADSPSLQKDGYDFARKLLGARWFSRAWCAHESRVVRHLKQNNPLFLCYGHDGRVQSFEFRFVHYTAMYLSNAREAAYSLTGTKLFDAMNDPDPQTLKQRWWRIVRLMPEGPWEKTSPMQHLMSILKFGCFKQGDLMSIALNTSGVPLAFTGDDTPLRDVIWMFSLLVLAAGDVTPLLILGSKLRLDDTESGGAISWAVHPHQAMVDAIESSPRIASITEVTSHYIELDLVVFSSLPTDPTMKSFEIATKLIAEHQLRGLQDATKEASGDEVVRYSDLIKSEATRARGELLQVENDSGPYKTFLPMWLAHAIDCGLEWTMALPDAMKQDTEDSWVHGTLGEGANAELTDAAVALLDHFISTGQAESDQEATMRDDKVAKLVRFLTCLLDPRFSFFTVTPRRLPCGQDDFAFTASISNRSWVAVPAAIAHLPAWHKRGWVIEPFDPDSDLDVNETTQHHVVDLDMELSGTETAEDIFPVLSSDFADKRQPRSERGTWRLRRQEEIFGCQRFGAIEDYGDADGPVMYLKKQRVYGADDYDWRAIGLVAKEFEAKHGVQHSSKLRPAPEEVEGSNT